MSSTKASVILSEAANASRGLLVRDGNKVKAPTWMDAPPHADGLDLLRCIEKGQRDFATLGLRASELPINTARWVRNEPSDPKILDVLIQATVSRRPVRVLYVNMRRNNKGDWRWLLPIALDVLGEQVRLSAQDLNSASFAVKTFVLTRILSVKKDEAPIPKTFIRASATDSKWVISTDLDSRLTHEQKQCIEAELGIKNGKVEILSRSAHEFKLRYSPAVVNADIVHPPFSKIELA